MTTLNLRRDNFDQDNTFTFAHRGAYGQSRIFVGYLARDNNTGEIYLMQRAVCLKDHHTAKDDEERFRLSVTPPVRDGDIVEVEGKRYKVNILGNYSDAGRLVAVE